MNKILCVVFIGVLGLLCSTSVFALTPKEQKGVKTLKWPTIEYLSPSWFTPFSLDTAPESVNYWLGLLPEQDRSRELYIVMPTLWLVAPVIQVPAGSADYATMQGGGEIDINSYLLDGVMHYPGTPLPDQEGNIVIFGHSNFYAAKPGRYKTIFADIMNLDAIPEDEIWLFMKQEQGSYELYKYRIKKSYDTVPTDIWILEPQWGKELTVFACTNGLAGRWILRAQQLPDEELLIPGKTKVRLRWLMKRFEQLTPTAQQAIRSRMNEAIETTQADSASIVSTMTGKMRKYQLRWIASQVNR